MGLFESLLLCNILRLRLIPLLILLVRVDLDLLPIQIGFWTCKVNGRGVPTLEDDNVCPKLIHTSTSRVAFSLWQHRRLRRGFGTFSLTRSFWDWRGRTFRALRGTPWRAAPLHSASDRGSGRLNGVRGLRELEVIVSAIGATRLRRYTVFFLQKPITCAPNICHRHRSHFQRVLVTLVPPHFRSGILDSTIPNVGTIAKVNS